MAVRIACFILMVVITPYGWYTWVLGGAAVFLPYIAVVLANVGEEGRGDRREDPERALPSAPTAPPAAPTATNVIRIEETRALPGEAAPDGREPDERA